jgi:hypothetical protein
MNDIGNSRAPEKPCLRDHSQASVREHLTFAAEVEELKIRSEEEPLKNTGIFQRPAPLNTSAPSLKRGRSA